jgi:lycopene beta-cyclase
MDQLFLRVLRRHPELGPNLFATLFRRCPSAPLVRFLTGTGSVLDGGRVALSMPKAPFLRALASAA